MLELRWREEQGTEKALVKIQNSCSKESIFPFSFSFKSVQSLSKPLTLFKETIKIKHN
jgi:hypothetical protein